MQLACYYYAVLLLASRAADDFLMLVFAHVFKICAPVSRLLLQAYAMKF